MAQFSTKITHEGDFEVVNLIDQKNSVRVQIIPELGNNLVSLTIGENNEQLELMYIPDEIKNLRDESYRFYGNPILFPFPGRIPEGKFTFQGQAFQLPINFRDGTAIHGFLYDKKWEIAETSAPSNEGAFLKSTYRSDTKIEEIFPFPFEINLTYFLRESELEIDFNAKNIGEKPFPFGYGIHPYFLLTGNRADWVLYFPANSIYELVNILPTGKIKEIPDEFDFRKEKSLAGIYMDDLFGNIQKNKDGLILCWLKNKAINLKLNVISDQNFDYYVLYSPKENEFICIEPYTCIANAFNLANSGIETGLRILQPKKTFKATIFLRWETG